MKKYITSQLIKVSLRQKAIFIPEEARELAQAKLRQTTSVLVANLDDLGYTLSEELLIALNQTKPTFQAELLDIFREVMGVNKNWTPLVKGWDVPTGESVKDHVITFFTNLFVTEETAGVKGQTELPCGHIIPPNTFPLERYNGCPFCGTPFEFGELENYGQGSKKKLLQLWSENNLEQFLKNLLASKTALDATQIDSLKTLLTCLEMPSVEIGMKETLMLVIDELISQDRAEEAQQLFRSPVDIMRYLWYKKTGFLQIIEPKTILNRVRLNARAVYFPFSKQKIASDMATARQDAQSELKLKYSRKECAMVANWINNLDMEVQQMCESMHPKRGMWIRFIRALRLAEYAKKPGFERLQTLLDVFYKQEYQVWQGRVDYFRLKTDETKTLRLLKQRPGLFARSLFANMLWFGPNNVVKAFTEIIDQVPARLVFTLAMYAENYFERGGKRTVKPLGSNSKNVPNHPLLRLYSNKQLKSMIEDVQNLCLLAMEKRFAKIENENKTIFIEPMLYKIPVSIGDRSETVQDIPSALMGTRFPLEGDTIRLFMQWGEGLSAMHLDMDLSCIVAYENKADRCSYSKLTIAGCKHSGDIRSIPEKVGTAEYIDINVADLKERGAQYVTFTCNAYSSGALSPNMVVGWMDSKHPMKISEQTGVAYDPSCVQHQVRITGGLTKGLVFGVLDVEANEIIWLEMPFGGQVVQSLNLQAVKSLLKKLESKLNIGALLELKAKAQNLEVVERADQADEPYTMEWAIDTAAVTQLLVD